MLKKSGELRKDYLARWAAIWIHCVVVFFLQIATLKHIIAILFVNILAPLIAHGGRFIQINDVDTRITRTGFQMDYHSGIGGKCSRAAVALNRGFTVNQFMLLSS
jgi:hypothetical protein